MRVRKPSFLAVVFSVFLGVVALQSDARAQFGDVAIATEKVGDGVYVFRYGIHRSLFVVSQQGVIVTDPLNEQAAGLYRQEIAKLTDAPVTHVIYTHSHWDRIAGGQVFKEEGAQFIMHEACAENLAEVTARTPFKSPAIVPPDKTFVDRLTVASGDQSIELFDFGPSHDKCLAIIHVPSIDALYMPELVSTLGASLPVEDITLGHVELSNIVAFFVSVEEMVKRNNVRMLVVGHARELLVNGESRLEPLTGPVSLLAEQRGFWVDTLGYMERLVDNGAQSMFLSRIIRYERFENYVGYEREAVFMMLRRIITWFATG